MPDQAPAIAAPPVAPDTFRRVMGHFVTGITVVTALDGDRPQGITVNALTSVSLEPPLVVVALDRRRFITPTVRATGRYAVNVLSEDQQALSDCFAGAPVTPDRDAFCGAAWTPGPTGLPLIEGAIATLECTVDRVVRGRRPRPVRRPGRLPRQRRAAPDAAALLPPPVPPDPAGRDRAARGRAGARDRRRPGGRRGPRRRRLRARTPRADVAANGLEIAYETHGSGPPLVMLHGATSIGREDFAAQIPLFSKRFQLILPDARGHGFTRWDASRGFQYDWLVEDVAAFTEAIGLETFHLLGFSMGAMTALQFATALPERLRTLVVAGISPQREPRASVARRLMDPRRPTSTTRTGRSSSPDATTRARASARGGRCCRRSPPTSPSSRC
jgi:flavin reductase (DIM6/NTAB) family NADH-FMN oxidoreductase RutF